MVIFKVKYMYISKRKKNHQQLKAIIDEYFTNRYISVDSLFYLDKEKL